MKFRSVVRRVKVPYGRAEPSQPEVSLATITVTRSAMRRHTRVVAGGMQPRNTSLPVCRRVWHPAAATVSPPIRRAMGARQTAGCSTSAPTHRTTQQPGRLLLLCDPFRGFRDPVIPLGRTFGVRRRARASGPTFGSCTARIAVRPRRGRPEPGPTGARGSEGCIRALTSGNGPWHPDPIEQRRPVREAIDWREP